MRGLMRGIVTGVIFVACGFSIGFAQEEITITTYYPSPYGVYSNLRSDVLGVGSTYRSTTLTDGQAVFADSVGIGTTTLTYALNVAGDINVTGEVRQNGGAYDNPDYVFASTYPLMPFGELKKFILEKRHLPNMPSTKDVREKGLHLFEQNRLLLEKLEEAYLYILKLEERVSELEKAAQ